MRKDKSRIPLSMNKTIEISKAYTRKLLVHVLPNIEIKKQQEASRDVKHYKELETCKVEPENVSARQICRHPAAVVSLHLIYIDPLPPNARAQID